MHGHADPYAPYTLELIASAPLGTLLWSWTGNQLEVAESILFTSLRGFHKSVLQNMVFASLDDRVYRVYVEVRKSYMRLHGIIFS